jgi:hypothetical protein
MKWDWEARGNWLKPAFVFKLNPAAAKLSIVTWYTQFNIRRVESAHAGYCGCERAPHGSSRNNATTTITLRNPTKIGRVNKQQQTVGISLRFFNRHDLWKLIFFYFKPFWFYFIYLHTSDTSYMNGMNTARNRIPYWLVAINSVEIFKLNSTVNWSKKAMIQQHSEQTHTKSYMETQTSTTVRQILIWPLQILLLNC